MAWQGVKAPAGGSAQTKSEYKLDLDCSEKKMNARAAEGWQLVSIAATVYNGTPSTQCAFRR